MFLRVPSNRVHFQVPFTQASTEWDTLFSELLLPVFQCPQYRSSPKASTVQPAKPLWREMPISEPSCTHLMQSLVEELQIITCLSKFLVKEPSPPPGSPTGATYGQRCPFPNLLLHISLPRGEKKQFCSMPTESSLSLLFSSRATCKSDEPLDVHRSLWATNPIFHGYKNSHSRPLQIIFRSQFPS